MNLSEAGAYRLASILIRRGIVAYPYYSLWTQAWRVTYCWQPHVWASCGTVSGGLLIARMLPQRAEVV